MREDFSKVLVERQRSGPRVDRGWGMRFEQAVVLRDPEAYPQFESSSRRRGGTKHLNEHLGPLVRFLRGNVGRAWNEVHRELASHVSRGNAVQAHVFQHLYDFVEVNTRWRDGEVVHACGTPVHGNYAQRYFYVCPTRHTLEHAALRPRRVTSIPWIDPATLLDTPVLRCLESVWYRVVFARVTGPGVRDAIARAWFTTDPKGLAALRTLHGPSGVYAASKTQLGKREIRALALVR